MLVLAFWQEYEKGIPPPDKRQPPTVTPDKRLLICTVTYQEPAAKTPDGVGFGGKMCGSNVNLQYGSRAAYIKGLDDLIAKPTLTMEMEFARDYEVSDQYRHR